MLTAEADDHSQDQPHFLDHLACVPERVDEEAEDEARHERQQRGAQHLRQRLQAEEKVGEVHERDQRQSAESTPRKPTPQRGSSVGDSHDWCLSILHGPSVSTTL